ncbi:MAG: polysaccharide biosynthesis protein [Vampirovibrio sp.]|jgi:O-antigen/teichoic acid export membrane protein|nr:polysaccharide biosynthesis protein [Vampirovibrio sp.]
MTLTNPDLSTQTKRSLFWSGGSYAITALLNFGTLFVLVKLLSPADMAMIFIAVIFQDLAMLFVDNGMGSYVVQQETLTHRERSSLFYQGLLLGVGLAAALYFASSLLALFFNSPALSPTLKITAFSLVPIALAFPQKGLLQKQMHFRAIATAEFIGMLTASAVTIGLAVAGYGFVSYLYGFLSRKALELLMLWGKEPWIPQICIVPEQVVKLFRFSAYAAGGVLSAYAVRLVDTAIVGRILGVQTLGLYSLANNLVFFPVNKCVSTFSRVFIATFSQLKHNESALKDSFYKAFKNLAGLLVPALLGLAIFIPDLMAAFFKPAWFSTAQLVQIMVLNGLLIMFLRLSEPLLLGLGKARPVFIINGINILLTSVLLLGLTPYGAQFAAWAVVLGTVPSVWLMSQALRELMGFSWKTALRNTQPIITASIVSLLSTISLKIALHSCLSPMFTLLLLGPLFLGLYFILWKTVKARA